MKTFLHEYLFPACLLVIVGTCMVLNVWVGLLAGVSAMVWMLLIDQRKLMTALSLDTRLALYRTADTIYRTRFWPLALTVWGGFCGVLYLSVQWDNYLSGADLSSPLDMLSDFAFIATCLTVGPTGAILFTTWLWGNLGIRLTKEGIVAVAGGDDIMRWTNIEAISVKRGRRHLTIKMVDSESSRIVKLRLNPTRYLDFCRKSLELDAEDTQIAHFLRDEIHRLAEK